MIVERPLRFQDDNTPENTKCIFRHNTCQVILIQSTYSSSYSCLFISSKICLIPDEEQCSMKCHYTDAVRMIAEQRLVIETIDL